MHYVSLNISKDNSEHCENIKKSRYTYRQAAVAEEAMREKQESQLGTEAFRVAFLELKQYM